MSIQTLTTPRTPFCVTSTAMDVSVIIISGRAGSGKTSVAFEVCEQLRRHGIPHANIDTDYLDDIWPQENGPDLLLKNLAAIWSTYYHDRGCRRLILSGTSTIIDTSQIQETIKQASQDSAETVENKVMQVKIGAFILTAEDSVASERLKKREIGSALERHLASSNKWGRLFNDFPVWAYRIPTDGQNVENIAANVLQSAGWIDVISCR